MTGILIKRGNLDTDLCIKIKIKVMLLEAKPRITKDAGKCPRGAGEHVAEPLSASEGTHPPYGHLDLTLIASRTVRE